MADANGDWSKVLLDTYGEPPEHPGIDEIIDDIKKASLEDIVFKSSSSVQSITLDHDKADVLETEEGALLQLPEEDKRKQLTPKMSYDMALKFLKRNEKLNLLLTMLDDGVDSLLSLRNEIQTHLNEEG